MNRKILIFILLSIFSLNAYSTHIVGGELRLIYLGVSNDYKIVLNLYFDNINGNPSAEDANVNVGIYSKASGIMVEYFNLKQPSKQIGYTFVPYIGDACQSRILSTRIITYQKEVRLDPNNYASADGYFIVWERCCRNNSINNIEFPGQTGNAFYVEFPAVRQNGAPFRNSSPSFVPPPGDFLCLNTFSSISFGASDIDGDVLVYSLVAPFGGNYATPSAPKPFDDNTFGGSPPASYDIPIGSINWSNTYSALNAIPSSVGQPLSINAVTGLLTVNPNTIGLFVFSVKCEEFRGGIKIGEIRRDYQFLVRSCFANTSPTITISTPQGNTYVSNTDMILNLQNKDASCFNVNIQDTPSDIGQLTIIPISSNFTNIDYTISSLEVIIGASGNSVISICWSNCKPSTSITERFIFDIRVKDGGCPNAGITTRRVTLYVKPSINTNPSINILASTPNFDNFTKEANISIGDSLWISLEGKDIDNDKVEIRASGLGKNTDFTQFGAKFTNKIATGIVSSVFVINTDCATFNQNKENIEVQFTVVEKATCLPLQENIKIKINIKEVEVDFKKFLPYNVFTPNDDTKNGYYKLDNLPKENCAYYFRSFTVYNRWGKQVYYTQDRNFQWEAEGLPSGLYYYFLDYNQKKINGNISILF